MKKRKRISTKKLSVRKHVESVSDFRERIAGLMKAGRKHIESFRNHWPKKGCSMRVIASVVVTLSLLAGCAGIGHVSDTNQLTPGMGAANVRAVMGQPSQTQFVSNKWVWTYSLHEPWKGFVPYYFF
jgi:hypothetical protein